jgi:hypothetical protein
MFMCIFFIVIIFQFEQLYSSTMQCTEACRLERQLVWFLVVSTGIIGVLGELLLLCLLHLLTDCQPGKVCKV